MQNAIRTAALEMRVGGAFLTPWCNQAARRPLKPEVAGANPVGVSAEWVSGVRREFAGFGNWLQPIADC